MDIDELDFKKGKVLVCSHCGNEVYMPLIYQCKDRLTDEEECIVVINTWTLYFCITCRNIILEKSIFEDLGFPEESYEIVYPPTVDIDGAIPESIAKTFIAAKQVQNKSNNASVLLLRSTLEKIAKDKGASGETLFDKMKELSDNGIIPSMLDKMATILRKTGNAVAHGDEVDFNDYTVNTLIDFTETIMNYIYVLPAKISLIEKRLERVCDREKLKED